MITVKPERSRLVAFARWATAQTPKVRTVGLGEFGVPADLFVHAPEEVLTGALVDGHRYVSPSEDAANGLPEPGDYQEELLGVATPEALVSPAEGAGDFAPLEDAPADDEEPEDQDAEQAAGDGGPFACDLCPREFTTERGRDSHRRQVHRED
ncbi:hypothetical protein ACIQTN_29485 [Streptomyces werraensis]|uniref:hypothetical protein n=1 Tax=Streptomyces werraensis TaxID=68284 RepID=UPI00382CA1ED